MKIIKVAIKYNGTVYSLPEPNRHHHVIRMIGGIKGSDTQGFLTDTGEFLTRKEAYQLALTNGQLNRVPGGYELFSEDLW